MSTKLTALKSVIIVCATTRFLLADASTCNAQLPSVIQLPSVSTFSYNGTVVVPDSGSGYLGGVKRSASRRSQCGLNRSVGRRLGNAGAFVSPTIIDQEELDRQILGGTPKEFTAREGSSKFKRIDRTTEGKSLVRFARKQYQQGDKNGAAYTYRLAIDILDGRLRQLAIAEYRRLY